MSLTLDALLSLTGRLDDSPGFDAPRERFRRFLLQYVTDLDLARSLIEECQRSVGAQHHRALQDLIVLLGRFLNFEISFDAYEQTSGSLHGGGRWRSPGLLDAILEIRTDQTSNATLEALARTVSEHAGSIGLSVVSRHYPLRGRLNEVGTRFPNVHTVSVQSLLSLASQVSAERLKHEDVVRLLKSGLALDFVVDLIDRPAAAQPAAATVDAQPERRTVGSAQREPAFWVATLIGDQMASAEQLLVSVISVRHLLPVSHAGRFRDDGSLGDWICFYLPDKGITGHGQLAAIVEDAASAVRDASRFSRVYRLSQVTLYDEPVVRALRGDRPFATPPPEASLAGAWLAPIGRQDFLSLTANGDDRLRTA